MATQTTSQRRSDSFSARGPDAFDSAPGGSFPGEEIHPRSGDPAFGGRGRTIVDSDSRRAERIAPNRRDNQRATSDFQERERAREVDDPEEIAQRSRRSGAPQLAASLPWLPAELLSVYIEAWVQTGDATVAWGKVRQDKRYPDYFPGNRRPDLSVRYDEQTWLAIAESYDRVFQDYGLPVERFAPFKQQLFESDMSPNELRERVQVRAAWVDSVSEHMTSWFRDQGWGETDRTTMLASALDPRGTEQEFRRRLSAAEIGGTAAQFGFNRDAGTVDQLMRHGVDRNAARQLYGQGATAVPHLSVFAQRYAEQQGFDISAFESAYAFGNVDTQRRARGLQQRERAAFSPTGSIASRNGARVGLVPQ